jgi:predicted enzyme related to lactoylglutathione lyase
VRQWHFDNWLQEQNIQFTLRQPIFQWQKIKTKNMSFKNAISWFEIPATDLERATRFYETIFDTTLSALDLPNIKMRMFPLVDMMGVGGAIVDSGGFHNPSSTDGPLIYLNGNPDLQMMLGKIEPAGGKVIVPKTEISPEYGYMAVFTDTEGNRIGLHSVPSQK